MIKTLIYVFLCIILWALIPVASKHVLKGMNNFAMLFFSNIISTAVMFIYLAFSKKLNELKSLNLHSLFYLSFVGFLGGFIFYIFLYKAFSLSSAQEVFIINYTWPVLIVLFSVPILHEKLTAKELFSLFLSFIGIIIIATKGNILNLKITNLAGDILAFFAAVSFALFSVLGKKTDVDESVAVFVYFLSSTIFDILTYNFIKINFIDKSVLFWLILNGLFINGISYIFWFKALKGAKAALISNLVYLTPFVSLIFISLFLQEKIEIYSIIALLFISVGITLEVLKKPT
ncbi:DMT family transporter [Hippea jasoniae]|uniref:DMT family transporter n=1 Tax=Hippea jasoniae TaxID=944479 RepID=UPI00054E09E6|nr:DMT family transporter [Hippea jasoniae]